MNLATSSRPADHVLAPLNYLVADDRKPLTQTSSRHVRSIRTDRYQAHPMPIRNGRPCTEHFSLDVEGFALRTERTSIEGLYDDGEVRRRYYPEVERLVRSVTGASHVLAFDHNVRSSRRLDATSFVKEPARVIHNDYTHRSGAQRLGELAGPDQAQEWLAHRVAVINVWRPIRGPLQTAPLAVCDARSVSQGQLVAADIEYPDRTGEIYYATHSPHHRWFYFPDMGRDEALLIKCYDSMEDGRARFTLHSAFDDPCAPPDALPRESIEVRTYARFEPTA